MKRRYTIIAQVQEGPTLGRSWRVKMSTPDAFHELPDPFAPELHEAWTIIAVVRGWPKVPYHG